jgi:hypothetical protein
VSEGGVFIPTREAIRKWAEQLRPDYAAKTRSGAYFVLLTWRPDSGDLLWSVGYSQRDVGEAREQAIQNIVEQRWRSELGMIL